MKCRLDLNIYFLISSLFFFLLFFLVRNILSALSCCCWLLAKCVTANAQNPLGGTGVCGGLQYKARYCCCYNCCAMQLTCLVRVVVLGFQCFFCRCCCCYFLCFATWPQPRVPLCGSRNTTMCAFNIHKQCCCQLLYRCCMPHEA